MAPTTPVGLALGSLCTLAELEGQSAASKPTNAMAKNSQQALKSSQRATFPADRWEGVESAREEPFDAVLFRAMMSGNIGI